MVIKWTKDLSVEEHELDGHHQHMMDLINKLNEALSSKEEKTIVAEVLAELSDYANYHFGAEEAMFELKHYPDAFEHIEQHMEFRERVKELDDLFQADVETAGKQLMDFLCVWWPNHIARFDKKYVPYLK
jgi:hemerythrin-like metal-binding protein